MKITEAARELNLTPRMLRYRESLGLLPAKTPGKHRVFDEKTKTVILVQLEIEHQYNITPGALAFAIKVLCDPQLTAQIRGLAGELGMTPISGGGTFLDFEKEKAMRALRGINTRS